MPSAVQEVGLYKQVANANLAVFTGNGEIIGVFVSAATSTPTLKVVEPTNANANATVVDTWTPAAATFYPIKAKLTGGCNIVMGGNCSITAIYNT